MIAPQHPATAIPKMSSGPSVPARSMRGQGRPRHHRTSSAQATLNFLTLNFVALNFAALNFPAGPTSELSRFRAVNSVYVSRETLMAANVVILSEVRGVKNPRSFPPMVGRGLRARPDQCAGRDAHATNRASQRVTFLKFSTLNLLALNLLALNLLALNFVALNFVALNFLAGPTSELSRFRAVKSVYVSRETLM
jgi:hypothetical protein